VIYNRETGEEFKLAEVYGDVMAAFSPDTTRLVRAEKRSESHGNLWVYNLENGHSLGTPTKLTDDVGIASYPTYSHDGKWIAYFRIINQQRDIWLVPASGGIPSRLTEHPAMDALPAWSPDNTKLAFVSDRDGTECIWIMNVAEGRRVGSPQKLTQSGLVEWSPTWSNDGEEIAYVGREGHEGDVWIAPVDGNNPARQITKGARAFRVQWDRATNRLFVSGIWGSDRLTLRTVSLDGSVSEELMPPVVFGSKSAKGVFDISMDGTHLVYLRQALSGDIWVLEATQGVY
jgi:Tol biopolymer transport system component